MANVKLITTGLPLYNSAQGHWNCTIGPLKFSNQSNTTDAVNENEDDSEVGDEDGDDTAQSIWSAAWSFATYVQQNDTDLFTGSIIELGSGTGVGGLAIAAAGGATKCTLTDLPSNLHILEAAVKDNQQVIPSTTTMAVSPLRWGGKSESSSESNLEEKREEEKYDVVIAIDCIYCHTLHNLLAETALRICKTDGRILIADEFRWSDNDKWWAETTQEHGLILVSTIELPSHERIPRKVLLREYKCG